MSKSNISDIDYSIFTSAPAEEKVAEQPKTVGISQRSIVKSKAKQEEAGRDLTGASESERIAQRTVDLANALPEVQVPDKIADYGLAGLGALGTGLAAWGLSRSRKEPSLSTSQEIVEAKPDLRNIQPVQQAPAAPTPQPTFPQATTQQPALPQGYGQQTMNAPTGAPAVPPTAGAGPQPVAPMTHEQLMQQEALEQARLKTENLRLKNQKLQTPATTAPASAKGSVSEAELQMIQKSGAAGTAKELQAMEAASKIAPTPDPIQTTATPVEKQAAVDVVKQQELKTGTGKPAIPGAAEPTTRFKSMYGSAAEVPKTHAFVPGAQYIDVLRNDLGQPTYTEQFSKREFPQTYLESVEAGKNINRELNRPTREQLKAQGAALPEPTEGITQKAAGKKLVKVGGVAGALIALSDLAKAETTKEREQAIGNALLGLLPPGMDIGGANAPGVQMTPDVYKLGSPYAQSEEAKRHRQAKKVGAGRGIAPPSAYQR